ncbi:hypothetical protein [Streptomyces sp. ICC4]|uniref:hypothetical protein n=1 Tax=Streptomyces sp. ICC4 TaxID=2099584 RepID=UPI0013A6A18D|nr:hypothetical protein [Streptomyces sp. ICC4]
MAALNLLRTSLLVAAAASPACRTHSCPRPARLPVSSPFAAATAVSHAFFTPGLFS